MAARGRLVTAAIALAAAATAELTTGARMTAVDIDYAAFAMDHTPGGRRLADGSLDDQRPAAEGMGGDNRRAAAVNSEGEITGAAAAGPRGLQDPNLAVDIWGLFHPTSVTWDNNGHVIISEKAGVLKIVDGWKGEATRVLLDIRNEVASYGDHGINHVQFFRGYLWLAYMKETPPWGDNCQDFGFIDRPLDQIEGCKISGRISRFPYDDVAGAITGPEEVVLEGSNGDLYCGQFSTHGMTMVVPGSDGFLYIAAGDGASFAAPDVGQMGHNPCNDPPAYPGAFRAQNPNRINGKILRMDPESLQWEVFASGVRNPFRLTWYNGMLLESETGWYTYEEINHIQRGRNYGWPCYEGNEPQEKYKLFDHEACAWLADGHHTPPLFAYKHPDNAAGNVMSISALAGYNGRIYYGDYTADVIYSINMDGSDQQVVLRQCYPVGLYATADSLIYINYNYGQVRSIPAAGVPVPSPSSTPAPIYLNLALREGTWTPGGGRLNIDPDSNIEGREGAQYTYTVRLLFNCAADNAGTCKVAELFTATEKHPGFDSPPQDGTLEVVATAATYKGTSITTTAYFPSVAQGATACTCPGDRTVVPASSLGIRPSATPSPSFRPGFSTKPVAGRSGASSIVSSKGFVGGISAAGAVVGVAALVAVGYFAGFFGSRAGTAKAPAPAAPPATDRPANGAVVVGGNDAASRPSSIAARRTSFPGAPPVATGAETSATRAAAGASAAAPARGVTPANGAGTGRTPGGARVV